MKKSWTQGLDDRMAEEIRKDYGAALLIRERLTQMLENKIRSTDQDGRSVERYLEPNWEIRQADINGFNRALEYVTSLIKNESQVE